MKCLLNLRYGGQTHHLDEILLLILFRIRLLYQTAGFRFAARLIPCLLRTALTFCHPSWSVNSIVKLAIAYRSRCFIARI